jgi:hypothetical protein
MAPANAKPKGSDRVGDVFDELLAEILEDHPAAMAQVIAHAPRNTDLPAPDEALEPSRDIHAVTEDITLLGHHIADIDTDPEAHPLPFGLAIIRACKRLLDLERAVDRVEHADEFGEHAIAGGVRNPPSMFPDQIVDYRPTGRQCRHRRLFVAMHQTAVALDIGGEDRHKPSLDRRSLHPRKAPILRDPAVSRARLRLRAGR